MGFFELKSKFYGSLISNNLSYTMAQIKQLIYNSLLSNKFTLTYKEELRVQQNKYTYTKYRQNDIKFFEPC